VDARLRAAAGSLAAALLLTGCVQSRPLPPTPTDAELAQLNTRVQDIQWQYLGFTPDAPRPDVDFVRYVDPDDTAGTYAECMIDAGFPDYDPYATANDDVGQTLALFVCISEYPLEPRYYNLFTTRQLEFLYDYYQEAVIPCLTGAGVDVGEIPTREQFTKPLQGGGAYLWSPWQGASELGQQEFLSISLRCPDYSFQMIRRAGE
jgi:hypothetical protein